MYVVRRETADSICIAIELDLFVNGAEIELLKQCYPATYSLTGFLERKHGRESLVIGVNDERITQVSPPPFDRGYDS